MNIDSNNILHGLNIESFDVSRYKEEIKGFVNNLRLKAERDYDQYIKDVTGLLIEKKKEFLSELESEISCFLFDPEAEEHSVGQDEIIKPEIIEYADEIAEENVSGIDIKKEMSNCIEYDDETGESMIYNNDPEPEENEIDETEEIIEDYETIEAEADTEEMLLDEKEEIEEQKESENIDDISCIEDPIKSMQCSKCFCTIASQWNCWQVDNENVCKSCYYRMFPLNIPDFKFEIIDVKKLRDVVDLLAKEKINHSYNINANAIRFRMFNDSIELSMNDTSGTIDNCVLHKDTNIPFFVEYKKFSQILKQVKKDRPVLFERSKLGGKYSLLINGKFNISMYYTEFDDTAYDFRNVTPKKTIGSIDVKKMQKALKKLAWACAKNESRESLNAVRVTPELAIVSDGNKFATIKNDFADITNPDEFGGFSIPFKCLEIMKNNKYKEGHLTVQILNSKPGCKYYRIGFIGNSISITDIVYPEYPNFEPVEKSFNQSNAIQVQRKELLRQAKLASLLSGERLKYLRVGVEDNKLIFKGNNPNQGESETWIDLDGEIDQDWVMGLNYQYIKQCLDTINSDIVNIRAVDHEHPFVLQGVDDINYNALIMPMRVQ